MINLTTNSLPLSISGVVDSIKTLTKDIEHIKLTKGVSFDELFNSLRQITINSVDIKFLKTQIKIIENLLDKVDSKTKTTLNGIISKLQFLVDQMNTIQSNVNSLQSDINSQIDNLRVEMGDTYQIKGNYIDEETFKRFLKINHNNGEISLIYNNEILAKFSDSDFIKDGMLENVTLEGDSLTFKFNTAAGKEPISITLPLSSLSVTIDSELNSTSENPVQNKAIYSKFSDVENRIENLNSNISNLDNNSVKSVTVNSKKHTPIDGNVNLGTYLTSDNLNDYYTKSETDELLDTKVEDVIYDLDKTSMVKNKVATIPCFGIPTVKFVTPEYTIKTKDKDKDKDNVNLYCFANDIDRDGIWSISDLAIIIDIMSHEPSDSEYKQYADLNGNGSVGIEDLNSTINYIIGKAGGYIAKNKQGEIVTLQESMIYYSQNHNLFFQAYKVNEGKFAINILPITDVGKNATIVGYNEMIVQLPNGVYLAELLDDEQPIETKYLGSYAQFKTLCDKGVTVLNLIEGSSIYKFKISTIGTYNENGITRDAIYATMLYGYSSDHSKLLIEEDNGVRVPTPLTAGQDYIKITVVCVNNNDSQAYISGKLLENYQETN